MLEAAYEECLCLELTLQGLSFERQVALPVRYKGVEMELGYRMDIVVEEKVVLELKAVEKLLPIYEAQLLTYLRLSGYRLGLLINFHSPTLVSGVRRLIA